MNPVHHADPFPHTTYPCYAFTCIPPAPPTTEDDPYKADKAAYAAAVEEYFTFMDTDNSGTISLVEIKAFVVKSKKAENEDYDEGEWSGGDDDEAEGTMKKMDADGDGTVNKEELLAFMVSTLQTDEEYAKRAESIVEFVAELKAN